MGFLAPALLGLGAVALVPVLLHLLREGDATPISFPALRYLESEAVKPDPLLRLRQILLLLTRILLVVLLVLAGARWLAPLPGGTGSPGAFVLLVDNGITSNAVVDGEPLLTRVQEGALALLEGAAEEDRIWILPLGSPDAPLSPLPPTEAAEVIRTLGSTQVRPEPAEAVDRATALLATRRERTREILMVGWPSQMRRGEGTTAPFLLLEPTPPPEGNRGIRSVEVAEGLPPRAGSPLHLRIRLEGGGIGGVPVRILLDDRFSGAGVTDEEGEALVPLPTPDSGWIAGWAEVDPDLLRDDDRRPFAFPISPRPVVGLRGSFGPHLEAALEALEEGGRIRLEGAGDVATVLIWNGEVSLTSHPPHLVVLPSNEPTRLPALNTQLATLGVPWSLGLPSVRGERRVVGGIPGLSEVVDVNGPGTMGVRRSHPLEALSPDSDPTVLLRLSDGDAWAVRTGEVGRVATLLGSPLLPEASDLPGTPVLIPLLDRLLDPTPPTPSSALRTGEPLPLPAEARSLAFADGTTLRVDGTPSGLVLREAGIYEVRDEEGNPIHLLAVAPAPREESANGEATEPLPATPISSPHRALRENRSGRELWRPLVLGVLFLLLLEGWLAAPRQGRPQTGTPILMNRRTPQGEEKNGILQ